MSIERDKQLVQIHLRAQQEIGKRSYAIWRRPWRVIRNRRLRAEIAAIMAVMDPEWKSGNQDRPECE